MAKRNWNVNSMDLAGLLELREEIDRAVRSRIESEQGALQARLDELSSLQDRRSAKSAGDETQRTSRRASGKPNPLKGRKVTPKYRGPEGQTWSGRGLAPRWLTELERKGKKREGFLIEAEK
jgi:DNA-binding protein H-NS